MVKNSQSLESGFFGGMYYRDTNSIRIKNIKVIIGNQSFCQMVIEIILLKIRRVFQKVLNLFINTIFFRNFLNNLLKKTQSKVFEIKRFLKSVCKKSKFFFWRKSLKKFAIVKKIHKIQDIFKYILKIILNITIYVRRSKCL